MTVETTVNRWQYITNGTTGPWTVGAYFLAEDDLVVTHTDADGADTLLVLSSGYTVTGAGSASGGTVTTTTPYAAGGKITIVNAPAILQESNYQDTDPFPAGTAMRNWDRLTMIAQWLKTRLDRCIRFGDSRDPFTEIGGPDDANMVMGTNDTGDFVLRPVLEGVSGDASALTYTPAGANAVGSTVAAQLNKTIVTANYSSIAAAITRAVAAGQAVRFDSSATINIPADAASVQQAIDHAIPGRQGVKITLNYQAGHKPVVGCLVEDGDYSCFEITSDDAEVQVSASWPANTCFLEGHRASMPTFSIVLDCNGKPVGGNDGYNLGAIAADEASSIKISEGCGVKDNTSVTCAGIIAARGSTVVARRSVFTGAALRNVWITHVSKGYFEQAEIEDATEAQVFVSRLSKVYLTGATISGGQYGVLAYRSRVMGIPFGSAGGPTFDGCSLYAILAQQSSQVIVRDRDGFRPVVSDCGNGIRLEGGSYGDLNGIDFTGITAQCIWLVGASIAQAREGTYDTAGIALVSDSGSSLDADSSTITACATAAQSSGGILIVNNSTGASITSDAIVVASGGKIHAINAGFPDAGQHGISCDHGEVWAEGADISGAGGHGVRCISGRVDISGGDCSGATLNGITATQGGKVNAYNANAQKGGSPDPADVVVSSGSEVNFFGGTGGISQTKNAISAAGAGVIYRD